MKTFKNLISTSNPIQSKKTTMSLKAKFPVIETIKKVMKTNDEIKIDQIKGYNRRVQNSPILELHVEMIQSLTDENHQLLLQLEELKKKK